MGVTIKRKNLLPEDQIYAITEDCFRRKNYLCRNHHPVKSSFYSYYIREYLFSCCFYRFINSKVVVGSTKYFQKVPGIILRVEGAKSCDREVHYIISASKIDYR